MVDAVVPHESGLHLLPAPSDVRDVEYVTPSAVRRVITLLRQHYDLVLLDVGSHVTPVQAAAVELADEVAGRDHAGRAGPAGAAPADDGLGDSSASASTTPCACWSTRPAADDEVQPDTLRKLAQSPVVSAAMPALDRKLEPAVNARDASAARRSRSGSRRCAPSAPRSAWSGSPRTRASAAAALEESGSRRGRRREASRLSRRRQPAPDAGQVTVETVALLPLVLLIMAICWQIGADRDVVGLARTARPPRRRTPSRSARAPDEVRDAALDRVPDSFRDRVSVTPTSGGDSRSGPGHA